MNSAMALRNDCEAFIFDLDGTLVDSVLGIRLALAQAFQTIGRALPTSDLRAAIGPPIRFIARQLEPTLTEDEALAIEQAYRPIYDQTAWRETTLFPGVAETLDELNRHGCRLFVITNKPAIPARNILDRLGLLALFEEVLSRNSTIPQFASKAAMLDSLVTSQDLSVAKSLMVGDTPEDREAAEANTMRFVFAQYGYGLDPSAQHTIACFAELLTNIPPAAASNPV